MSLGGGSQSQGQSSGTSNSVNTQPYIVTGPTVKAANNAADAQINAAQIAANAATQNTESAIQALMGQYGTALQYAQPQISTGNQALAQLNYALGLPAVSPGAKPTAPVMPNDLVAPTAVNPITINDKNLSQYYGSLVSQAQHTPQAAGWIADQPLHDVTSVAEQIAGTPSEQLSAGQKSFLQQYYNLGGYAGETGGDFGKALTELQANSPAEQQYKQDKNAYDLSLKSEQNEFKNATQAYNQQLNQWNNSNDLYKTYQDKGILTPEQMSNMITNTPGFSFQRDQGISTIENAASASGMLNSGNILRNLDEFGQKLSGTYYQNYLGNLANVAGLGAQATGQAVSGATNLGQQLAQQYTNQGNAQGNAALATGQSLAGSYLAPAANQQVIFNPYTTKSNTNFNTNSSSSTQNNPGVFGTLGAVSSLFGGGGSGGGLLGGLF